MKLILLLSLCIGLFADCELRRFAEDDIPSFPSGKASGFSHRWKRAGNILDIAVLIGYRALKYLLKDSKPVFSPGPDRVFEKRGGYNAAAQDFFSLEPMKIDNLGDHLSGVVGDRQVILQHSGRYGEPTLSLIKPKNDAIKNDMMRIDTIIYKP